MHETHLLLSRRLGLNADHIRPLPYLIHLFGIKTIDDAIVCAEL